MLKRLLGLCALAVVALSGTAHGAVAYSVNGSTYLQDFNSLPTGATETAVVGGWVDDTTLPGWYSNQTTLFRIGQGGNTTGAQYSYGTLSSTERALGSLGGGSGTAGTGTTYNGLAYGVAFVNTTGQTLTSITVTYTGEQWRNGGNATAHKLTFGYQTFASLAAGFITATGYTGNASLDFTGPIATATAAALDGNAAANRTAGITATIAVTWNPGDTLVLRWDDRNDAGNDHGLAIDDLSFTATPTPGSLALLGLGGLVASRRRR